MHAAALALATKVDRGEMSREDATSQLVQVQLVTLGDQRNSASMQDAATPAFDTKNDDADEEE